MKIFLTALLAFLPSLSLAQTLVVPDNFAKDTLSEAVPFSFSPIDISAKDFELEWVGKPLDNVDFHLASDSLEWVRVRRRLVLPRGRVVVKAQGIESGQLSNQGYLQTFAIKENLGESQLPVALISGTKNLITIKIRRKGKLETGEIMVQFHPKKEIKNRVAVDHTCSPYGVKASDVTVADNSYAIIGCRFVWVRGEKDKLGSVEMYVFWNGPHDTIEIDGIPTEPESASVWLFRLRKDPGIVRFDDSGAGGRGSFTLTYQVPDVVHWGFLGMGIGPYAYNVDGGSEIVSTYVPLMTLYASYYLVEGMRLVMFNATAFNSTYFTDFGVYLLVEQFKFLDERISMNLLLGGHALAFKYEGKDYVRPSGPQGIELIFRDLFRPGYNLGIGGFLHPEFTDGRSYINAWVRWGPSSWFLEFNYIAWKEAAAGDIFVNNRSAGITVGFPIAGFF